MITRIKDKDFWPKDKNKDLWSEEDKDKDLWSKDKDKDLSFKDKDLWSEEDKDKDLSFKDKDKDLQIGPGESSRTKTFLNDYNTAYMLC